MRRGTLHGDDIHFFQRGVLLRGMVLLEGWRGARCKEYRWFPITGLIPLSRISTHFCVKDSGGSRFEKRAFPLSHDEALHSVSACVHVNSHSGKRSLLVAMESPLDAGLSSILQPSRKTGVTGNTASQWI